MASPGHGRRRGTAKARTADAAAARRGAAAPALRRRGRGDGARRGRHRRPRGGLPGVDRPGAGPRPRAGRSGRVGRPREEGGRGQVRKRGSGGPPAAGPATWGADEGWAGVSRDTAHLAVASPRSWWDRMGGEGYSGADGLVAACGGGGPNGSCDRPRERELRLSCDRRRMGAGAATFRPAPPGGAGPGTAPSPRSPATGAAGRPPGSLEVIAGPVASTTTSGGRGRVRGRPAPARGRDQGHRRGDGRPRHPRGGLPRRVELCHKASRRG